MSPDSGHHHPHLSLCGIGASAGGVEALREFFRDLPPDLGLAYIVIIHLSPGHRSELPAIIGRWTTMPVVQVADHQHHTLAADHVFVIAPGSELEILDSSVAASPMSQARGQRTVIDRFFRSLAVNHGDGFAVILSGGGSDGALGAKAIKERGGLVLVQDPRQAAYESMPRATIATGVADVVLPVGDSVARLSHLARLKARMPPAWRDGIADDDVRGGAGAVEDKGDALAQMLDLVRRRTGHDFAGYKPDTLLRRVMRRVQLSDCLTIRDYLARLRADAAEIQALYDDLLISVTTFFRDRDAWESLRLRAIAPIVRNDDDGDPIRVWVPGCATGEEAYTLAILILEELERQQVHRELTIFATDVDQSALAVARLGVYPASIADDVSAERLNRFFTADGEHYQVLPDVRDQVVFAPHNLLQDPPFAHVQLASCRNVLIYFERDRQHRALDILRYACQPDGFLFLGHAEAADEDFFRPLDAHHRIYRMRTPSSVRPTLPELGTTSRRRRTGWPKRRDSGRAVVAPVTAQSHIEVLEALSPPTVLIDERWTVLHVSPSAARFFQQGAGPLATDVTRLVRVELRPVVSELLRRASAIADAQVSDTVAVRFDDANRKVVTVAQRRSGESGVTRWLLTFLDTGAVTETPAAPRDDRTLPASLLAALQDAQQHLERVREDARLQGEDLRAVFEELQSVNEEYRSTTEELETSREELQSTNEELQTINHELKMRLEEVSRARSDVENLMAATNVATLFLTRDLRIRLYTRQLEEIFTIRPRDIERPIGDLRHNLDYPDLEEDVRRVVTTLAPIERQVSSRSGQAFVARMSPYHTADAHLVDGVVCTFIDVTALKESEAALRTSQDDLERELAVLRRLDAMTLGVATSPHLVDALSHVLAAAIELHGADMGFIALNDGAESEWHIVTARGCPTEFLDRCTAGPADTPSVFSRLLASRVPTQIADVTEETDASLHELGTLGRFRGLQATPLLSRSGELQGALWVFFRHPHPFDRRDEQLTSVLGHQAGDSLDARVRQLQVSASQFETSEVRDLLRRLVTVQEEERRAMARDIHDQLGQSMTALRLQIDALHMQLDQGRDATAALDRVERRARELDHSIDELTWQFRPAVLDSLGLPAALRELVHRWSDHVDTPADFDGPSTDRLPALDTEVAVNLYRVVQEALHNIQKHAHASHVRVHLVHDGGSLSLVIEDDGRGFEAPTARATGHGGELGLVSMRERTRLVGGELEIASAPGSGTRIALRVPVKATPAP